MNSTTNTVRTGVKLAVWFSPDRGSFTRISPDVDFTSVPHPNYHNVIPNYLPQSVTPLPPVNSASSCATRRRAEPGWGRVTYKFEGVSKRGELTLHRDEFTPQTIADLAKFLREAAAWNWTLFTHCHDYPAYAWARMAAESLSKSNIQDATGGDWMISQIPATSRIWTRPQYRCPNMFSVRWPVFDRY